MNIVFTDLDGTLLDTVTYEWKAAREALDLCGRLKVPVIPVSSKTRAEMEPLHREMGLTGPFITENGGGIFYPSWDVAPPEAVFDRGAWKVSLGEPYHDLVEKLQEIREETGLDIRGFSDMGAEEISSLTGLGMEASVAASRREFNEPFLVGGEETAGSEKIAAAVRAKGLTLTRGGRFFHLHGRNDKGRAVARVIAWYEQNSGPVTSIALGDSPNDFSMLKIVDYPVLVGPEGVYPELKIDIPGLSCTGKSGPAGWNDAVIGLLAKKK